MMSGSCVACTIQVMSFFFYGNVCFFFFGVYVFLAFDLFFFFFQAEDGIRDWSVTGVQTCALPICSPGRRTGTGPIGVRCGKREPGKSCKQYLFESLHNPTAYVVPGYQPIMPVMTKQLSPEQVWAVIAFLESQGGTVDVTASDIPSTTSTASSTGGGGGGGGGGLAGGSTDPKAIIQDAGCLACHK